MSVKDRKITETEKNTYCVKSVQGTRLTGTVQENKNIFDRLVEFLAEKHNLLIDDLDLIEIEKLIVSEDIKYLRVNSDQAIEVSRDGETWRVTGSSGHIILDPEGRELPQRTRMKFTNSEVADQNGITVVRGIKGDKGDTGAQGPTGATGIQGPKGDKGDTGKAFVPFVDQTTGIMSWTMQDSPILPPSTNVRGPQGIRGSQGETGPRGETGRQGEVGPQGIRGLQGEPGPKGDTGLKGDTGIQGPQGLQGVQGKQGEPGPEGPKGLQGPNGPQGATGAKGDQGEPGARGPAGPTGEAGPKGDQGPIGPIGPIGPKGIQGIQGQQGIQGIRGADGADGKSFVIEDVYPTLPALRAAYPAGNDKAYQIEFDQCVYIWSELIHDWTSLGRLRGPQGEQGLQGIQGPQGPEGLAGEQGPQGPAGDAGQQGPKGPEGPEGPKGDPGPAGNAATVTVSSTVTGEAGSVAEVINEGTANAAILKFKIPRGAQGPKGDQGLQGIQGVQGEQGPKGDQGEPGLQGLKGDTGTKGDKGDKGDTGTAGPNTVSAATSSNITGLLKGDGTKIAAAVANTDYATPAFVNSAVDGAKGKKVARFVIGTTQSGWTSSDCDYLCDGSADQVEINAAIQALPPGGGEIVILDGTYNIEGKVDVNKSSVSIRGNGNATVLKRMWNSSVFEGAITLTGISNCRIENLQIDGNKSSYAVGDNHSICLNSSSNNNTIIGNTCNNNNGRGIYLNASSNNNTIIGNTCNNNNICGIYVWLSNGNAITSNICNNTDSGIILSSSNSSVVTGNTCNYNFNSGIKLNSGSNNNTITGNICNDNNAGGIILSTTNSNNIIAGNTCNNNVMGIQLYRSSNNTITGNTCIRGYGETGDYTSSQHTIKLNAADTNYNLISSNNCKGKAPTIEGGIGNTVNNNKWSADNLVTAIISTTWTGSSAPYTQDITINGVMASTVPKISPVYSTDNATAIAQKQDWNMISKITTGADKITVTCFEEKPTAAIPIQLEGVF